MLKKDFVLYLLIGTVNSIVGYILIFTFMLFGIPAEISNFLGYMITLFISYGLNRQFSFKSENSHINDLPKFVISMAVSYIANLLTLVVLYRIFDINVYASQILAGGVYTMSGYMLSKFWVFRRNKND